MGVTRIWPSHCCSLELLIILPCSALPLLNQLVPHSSNILFLIPRVVFNVGEYRRAVVVEYRGHELFDPDNKEGTLIREWVALTLCTLPCSLRKHFALSLLRPATFLIILLNMAGRGEICGSECSAQAHFKFSESFLHHYLCTLLHTLVIINPFWDDLYYGTCAMHQKFIQNHQIMFRGLPSFGRSYAQASVN